MTPPTVHGLMLCDDLMFFSRVAGTARAAGLVVRQVRTAAALLDLAKKESPGGVIVDLNNDGLDVAGLMVDLREGGGAMPRTVAFGSHVDVEKLREARVAGCDLVLARSQFVDMLEGSLRDWVAKD